LFESCWQVIVVVDRGDPQSLGGRTALWRGVGDDHLRSAVLAREESGQQSDQAASGDQHQPAAYAVAKTCASRGFGRGMQDAVGGDRAEVCDVDTEQRVQVVRQRHHMLGQQIRVMNGLVPVGHRDQTPGRHSLGP